MKRIALALVLGAGLTTCTQDVGSQDTLPGRVLYSGYNSRLIAVKDPEQVVTCYIAVNSSGYIEHAPFCIKGVGP